jgi:hypothetical protein
MSASRKGVCSRWALLSLAVIVLAATPAVPQNLPRPPVPRPEPVAETRLLMDGLTRTNFRGLDQQLKEKPADLEAWTFARGRALLIAETANLLMLRPPRNQGQDAWLEHCRDLREVATNLARHAANQDYTRCRVDLREMAGTCNRCHQTFRVNVQVGLEGDSPGRPAGER